MTIRVEFYGVARWQAGCDLLEIEAATLGESFERLAERLPEFAALRDPDGGLQPGFLASINGKTFTRDRATRLNPGDALLILSADVGG